MSWLLNQITFRISQRWQKANREDFERRRSRVKSLQSMPAASRARMRKADLKVQRRLSGHQLLFGYVAFLIIILAMVFGSVWGKRRIAQSRREIHAAGKIEREKRRKQWQLDREKLLKEDAAARRESTDSMNPEP